MTDQFLLDQHPADYQLWAKYKDTDEQGYSIGKRMECSNVVIRNKAIFLVSTSL